MKIENQIELADIPKVLVQHFHVVVDDFHRQECVFLRVDACNKEETGVSVKTTALSAAARR